MAVINILEDDEVIRGQLSQLLRDKGYEVIESADISSFNKIDSENTDLYLLDVYLPDGDGFSVCEKLRSEGCVTPVIFLTSCDDEDSITKGLDIGGDDYITKPFNILEVKARMKAIFRRSGGSESEGRQSEAARKVISSGSLKLDCDARTLQISGREIYLTAKEFDLMELLASNPGKVYSRESLLNTVWGYDYPGDVRTVDVHVRRLREKVEPNASDPKYIQTKWGVGYYFGQN